MPVFHAIAAMSENRVIGYRGKMPWHLPEDFRWFKHKTMGGTLLMGRKTFESIGKPLPGRQTLVLSRSVEVPGVVNCRDIATLDETLRPLPKPCWICGGTEVYRQFLRSCQFLYLTRLKRTVSGDTFFPPFEDKFELDQLIHENNEFRVERWRRLFLHELAPLDPEPWLAQEPTV